MTDGGEIHEGVLDNLLDGVLVVETGGRIAMFNPAAGRILGIPPGEAAGKMFVELFIAREGFDEFTELILAAVVNTGEEDRRVITLRADGAARSLSVATSYLTSDRDGGAAPAAVIAVFSDISEIRELRDTELRLAKEVEAQHTELQMAYREIEERNERLGAMLKKVQVARVLATLLVIGVFVGAGLYAWQPLDFFVNPLAADAALPADADADGGNDRHTIIVEPQPVRTTISVLGTLAPWRTVNIASPVASRVGTVHFQYGQEVAEGELLVELETTETQRDYREARLAYLEAQEKFDAIKNWENGPEMADARRSLTRAKLQLDNQESHLNQIAFLLEQGLVAASDHESAEQRYRSQQLDFESAQQDFEAVRARGSQEARDKAEIELDDARERMLEIEQSLREGVIHAPIAGVVLLPESNFQRLATGKSVEKGDALLEIGDFARMSAVANVDEVDVVRIEVDQAVRITVNPFPSLRFGGSVTHVSSQADRRSRRAPEFPVVVTLDPLEAEQRALLRAGMSSRLEIVVYRNDAALLVPIDVVERRGRKHRLWVVDPETGETRAREVEIGTTTLDSVEILAGLEAGSEIIVPAE